MRKVALRESSPDQVQKFYLSCCTKQSTEEDNDLDCDKAIETDLDAAVMTLAEGSYVWMFNVASAVKSSMTRKAATFLIHQTTKVCPSWGTRDKGDDWWRHAFAACNCRLLDRHAMARGADPFSNDHSNLLYAHCTLHVCFGTWRCWRLSDHLTCLVAYFRSCLKGEYGHKRFLMTSCWPSKQSTTMKATCSTVSTHGSVIFPTDTVPVESVAVESVTTATH